MKVHTLAPPRGFCVGAVHLSHCADIELEPDEQVTFTTGSGTEYDVVRKSWGYYATPSLNGRLKDRGLRGALAQNRSGKLYLLLAEPQREHEFRQYLADEQMELLGWLDQGWPPRAL